MVASNTAGYSFTGGDHMGATGSTNITSYTQMGGSYRRKGKSSKAKRGKATSKAKRGKATSKAKRGKATSKGYKHKVSKKVRKLTNMRRNVLKTLGKKPKSKKHVTKKKKNEKMAIKNKVIASIESGKKPSKEDLSKLSPSVQSFLDGISTDSKASSGSSLRLSKMSSSPPSSEGSSMSPWPSLSGYTPKKGKKGQKGKKGKVSTKSFESARKELEKLLKQGKVRSRSR